MSVVTQSRHVSSPVAKVWEALSDFGGVHRFAAGVKSSPIIKGTPDRGVGSERSCTLYDGNTVLERVTESIENKRISVEIFESSMPIKTADATFTLAPAAGGGTDIIVTMEYVVKYGPIGVAMDVLMMRSAMNATFENLLAGLDHHLQTGESIGNGWKPQVAVAS